MNVIRRLSEEDHQKVATAIREAETRTSGEIFAVVAGESDDYFFVAAFVSALWAIFAGCVLAVLAAMWSVNVAPWMLMLNIVAQLALALFAFRLFPALRLLFVPNRIAFQRASANAVRQFLAHGIHETKDRSGVLIFVSLAEHYAEVVADAGINEKVTQDDWNRMVATLIDHAARDEIADGFVKAIEQAGDLLAAHFPPVDGELNELDDKLIEL